jgi:glycosyltransferase involved in cell wall biosynthesis
MSTPLKVLHVEAGKNLYGGALQVLYLIRGLQARGVKNVLVCPRDSAIAGAAANAADRVYGVRFTGDLDLPFVFQLWRIIGRERPDLVHLHSRRGADTLGGIAAALAGAKVILTRRVDNPESALMVRLKYRLYDRVVTISQAIRGVLIDEGLSADAVACVHSAVDAAAYAGTCDRARFEQIFDIPPGHRVCATIAQLIPRKGHRHLLAALPRVLARHPDTVFVFFGKGPLEAELRERCARAGLTGAVRFAGYRDDLARWLPCVDVVVHPAEMEGLGVSLLQAAAAGVPIVGTGAGGIPEIVRHGVNGLLVPPGDSAAIAGSLLELLGDPERAGRLGRAGRDIVLSEFSIDAMVEGNLAVYRELASGHAVTADAP